MGLYADITFPEPPSDRPYAYINMVSTIDGKIVSGAVDEPVMDLGSKFDHETLRNLEQAADAIWVGAGTVHATPKMWFAPGKPIYILSGSGDLPYQNRVFTDAPELITVVTRNPERLPQNLSRMDLNHLSLPEIFLRIRQEHGIRTLIVEGGSQVNGALLQYHLVDELFLTLAPKIKLGDNLPTYANGQPFGRGELPEFELISAIIEKSEVFLRYRRK